mmetsp:Transcript_24127/g.41309  ORF Transcript_24127/g.41309 Transcript_24127/m.41309 type:complete len:483 (-) Transcript_24127:146-1594(-)
MAMILLRSCLRKGGGNSIRGVRNIVTHQQTASHLSPQSTSPLLAPITNSKTSPKRASPTPSPAPLSATLSILPHSNIRCQPFSSSGKDDEGNNNDDRNLFLSDEDSLPAPPSYVRDSITGKWTSETHAELSSADRKILNSDDETKSEAVIDRLGERWTEAAKAAEGAIGTLNEEHERVAGRIQEQQLALGTIGRDPADSIKKVEGGDDAVANVEKPLTPSEFQALKVYAQEEHNIHPKDFARLAENDPDLIPHNSISSGAEGSSESKQFFDADLDLAYLNPKLHRKAFKQEGAENEDPFADLLPSDLNPARKVNRRHAKPIPRKLLHHNNLSLLRRYTTPGGKIMNRVQSRLGAKDQRKIAKLVKRARHLGLIPYLGQWKFEDHGNRTEGFCGATAEDEEGKRDWEIELENRGLWPLADETELVKKFYDMDKMIEHIAGPKGGKKREEIEELLGGMGALVMDEKGTPNNGEDGKVQKGKGGS